MKRIVCSVLAAICAAICLTGCAGMGDWASRPLAGNYEIWRLSVHNIVLLERDSPSGGRIVIDAEIYAVAWTDDYILLQHEAMEPDPDDYGREPHGALDYYVLLVEGGQVLGPYDEAGFADACREHGIPAPETWTNVHDLPRRLTVR
ncbi:MAG: DUF3997 domain-containing protein [Oscillospiraceae bacterium]|nr:DUF3997 domain-containing protein [Oscillospiraceae bacterium]